MGDERDGLGEQCLADLLLRAALGDLDEQRERASYDEQCRHDHDQQQVLHHVDPEEHMAVGLDRRVQADGQHHDAEHERDHPVPRQSPGLSAVRQDQPADVRRQRGEHEEVPDRVALPRRQELMPAERRDTHVHARHSGPPSSRLPTHCATPATRVGRQGPVNPPPRDERLHEQDRGHAEGADQPGAGTPDPARRRRRPAGATPWGARTSRPSPGRRRCALAAGSTGRARSRCPRASRAARWAPCPGRTRPAG